MRYRVFVLLCAVLACGLAGCPPQAPTENPATGKKDGRRAVAELLGKPAYMEDCISKTAGISSPEVGIERLVAIVVGKDYFKDQEPQVTDAEIRAFEARLKTAADRSFEAAKAQRDAISRELAAADLPAAKRQELELQLKRLPTGDAMPMPPPFDAARAKAELEAVRKRLKEPNLPWLERLILEGQEKSTATAVEKQSVTAAMATGELQALKSDALLHKRFGGKVVGVQMGIKPVEAYYTLMREYEKSGKVRILDADLRNAFWKRMDEWLKQPAVPPEQVDFTWPAWMSDALLNRPAEQQHKK